MTNEHGRPVQSLIPNDKEQFLRLIEAGREILDDDQMSVLFALYEEEDISQAAAMLGMSESHLEKAWLGIIGETSPQPDSSERLTKKGNPYLKRLSRSALMKILLERNDMTDEDRKIVIALANAPNQPIAAHSLGMRYDVFARRFIQIRREYDF